MDEETNHTMRFFCLFDLEKTSGQIVGRSGGSHEMPGLEYEIMSVRLTAEKHAVDLEVFYKAGEERQTETCASYISTSVEAAEDINRVGKHFELLLRACSRGRAGEPCSPCMVSLEKKHIVPVKPCFYNTRKMGVPGKMDACVSVSNL